MLWVRISIRTRCTTLCDKVCQWLATGRWFSPGPPVSSTNKTDRYDITEILLKVALIIIKPTNKHTWYSCDIWLYKLTFVSVEFDASADLKKECGCLISCDFTTFDQSISTATFPAEVYSTTLYSMGHSNFKYVFIVISMCLSTTRAHEMYVTIIVPVYVFVCHMFSYHPFYFDFHSAHVIFNVSSGFYFWNVNRIPAWPLSKMFKVAFKDVSTKNSEPTYWTILFVMLKIYFIYKVAGKKSRWTI